MSVTFPDIDIPLALSLVRPGSEYGRKGETDSGYATLTDFLSDWRDGNTTIPTNAELLAVWQAYVDTKAQTDADAAVQAAVQASAKTDIQNIPNWASWTKTQLQSWWDANLSDAQVNALAIPAGAKTIIIAQNHAILAMGLMLIALRNREFPDLQT